MTMQTAPVPTWNTVEKTTLVRYVNVDSARDDRLSAAHEVIAAADPSVHELVESQRFRDAAAVVYDALKAQKVSYTGPGYSSTSGTQKVFLPEQLAERGRGTCVDMAVTFCALALDVELRPYLIGTPGHVFAMVANSSYAPMLGDDVTRDSLRPLLEAQHLIPVETTGTTLEQACSFSDAVDVATTHLKSAEVEFVLDVENLQHVNGLQPFTPVPEPPGPNWPARIVSAMVAIATVSGLLFWWLQPDPLPGVAATNIAAMKFSGDDSGTTDELRTRVAGLLEEELEEGGWKIGGTFDGTFPGESVDADDGRLHELNAGVAVYGTVSDDKIDTVGVWVTPEMEGASFLGTIGPVALIDKFPNTSTPTARVTIAAEQFVDFVELAHALSHVHNAFGKCDEVFAECTDDQVLDSASRTLLTLTLATGQSGSAAYQTQQLARLALAQVSLARLVYPGTDGELRSELIELARRMLTDTLAAADERDDRWSEFRASLATSNLLVIIDQCSGGQALTTASSVLDDAERLVSELSSIQQDHGGIRLAHAQSELSWCQWHAGEVDRDTALALHDQAVATIRGADDVYFEELKAHLLADTLFQRAELRAGIDSAGCDQDLVQVSGLAPPFAEAVYDTKSMEWSCDV